MRPRYIAELWNEYMHRLITNLPANADINAIEACAAAADRCLDEYRRRFPVTVRTLGEAQDYVELCPPPESPAPADAGHPRELLMAAAVCWALAGMGAEEPHIDRTPCKRARLGEWTVYPGAAGYPPTLLHVYRHGVFYRTARIGYISKDLPEVADTYREALAALVGATKETP